VLEFDRTILQETSRLEEHGFSYQMREMAVHPYLGIPIDEVQTDVVECRNVVEFPSSSLH